MPTISVRQLAQRCDINPNVMRGVLIGLGVRVVRTPAALLVSETDARKAERAVARERQNAAAS